MSGQLNKLTMQKMKDEANKKREQAEQALSIMNKQKEAEKKEQILPHEDKTENGVVENNEREIKMQPLPEKTAVNNVDSNLNEEFTNVDAKGKSLSKAEFTNLTNYISKDFKRKDVLFNSTIRLSTGGQTFLDKMVYLFPDTNKSKIFDNILFMVESYFSNEIREVEIERIKK